MKACPQCGSTEFSEYFSFDAYDVIPVRITGEGVTEELGGGEPTYGSQNDDHHYIECDGCDFKVLDEFGDGSTGESAWHLLKEVGDVVANV